MSRTVLIGEHEYVVDVMVSSPPHRERLGSDYYVHVELPGEWKAVFGAPRGLTSSSHLQYRDLALLVREAQRVVALRKSDVGAATE